jgi:phosphoenolpyruvate carboxylase
MIRSGGEKHGRGGGAPASKGIVTQPPGALALDQRGV